MAMIPLAAAESVLPPSGSGTHLREFSGLREADAPAPPFPIKRSDGTCRLERA